MARRVRQSVKDQATGSIQIAKPTIDLEKGAEYALPTNQRSIIFLFFEFGLFFAAALAMWPVDQIMAAALFAIAIALPLFMFYIDGRKTPRSVMVYEDRLVLKYRFGQPVTVFWDDIEFLQRIEVFERLSSRSKPLGWMKSRSMKSPVVLSFKAGEAAIYAYTLKKGVPPPEKLIEKEPAKN
jgi:hypothetical protein